MKNQVNISNQKVNYWMISTLLLIFFLVVEGWYIWKSNSKYRYINRQPTTTQTNQLQVTGVIRTSGLLEEERQKFGLSNINYQITDFGEYQEGQTSGYYLMPTNVNDELLGKCVRVTGMIPEQWKNKNKDTAYNRLPLILANIEKVDNSNCNPYPQTQPVAYSDQEKLVLPGTVIHGKRPAPDIGYDYQLKLTEPFIDQFSSTGSRELVSLIDVIPTNNDLWVELENNINREITLEGYMVWGYAETRYFEIIAIKTADDDEKIEIKNLVSKVEQNIQERNVDELMSLFTPPKTAEETASYRILMGLDPDIGVPRLFNNVTSNFVITYWEIARREYPDNLELISKKNNIYFVTVKETRKSWCNSGPCIGTYSFENNGFYVFELVKENSVWKVDKYYPQPASPDTTNTKYAALYF